MATLRELKGRIGSVASSEKITGAMKMISSAKMHKAEGELRKLQPFRSQIETIIGSLLSTDAEFSSPLTTERPVKKTAIVILGSDDGLCGAYNVNLFKFLKGRMAEIREQYGLGMGIDILPVGKKMEKTVAKLEDEYTTVKPCRDVNSKSTGDSVKDFNKQLQEDFISGVYDRIDIIYMNFRTVSRQIATAQTMLPLSPEVFSKGKSTVRPCIFEPGPGAVFAAALPMFLQALLMDVFCENRASEQAARVMAMQSANDNAKKLLEQLRLEYNKLRQQSITSELLDIVGGQIKN